MLNDSFLLMRVTWHCWQRSALLSSSPRRKLKPRAASDECDDDGDVTSQESFICNWLISDGDDECIIYFPKICIILWEFDAIFPTTISQTQSWASSHALSNRSSVIIIKSECEYTATVCTRMISPRGICLRSTPQASSGVSSWGGEWIACFGIVAVRPLFRHDSISDSLNVNRCVLIDLTWWWWWH
jgi:hypothetical protein